MGSSGVFSAEMPDEPSQAIVPLDADTAERLLSARLDPDDAPPGYAEVARLLQAAAAPADQIELTGQAAAMDAFRTTHPRPAPTRPRPTPPPGPPPGTRARPAGSTGRPGGSRDQRVAARGGASGARGRVVALALAGALAAGAVGVWTAGGAPFSRELGSPSGGPSAGGPGSATPGSGPYGPGGIGSGADATGSLRPAWPSVSSAPGATQVTNGRPPAPASTREPATARHTGDVTSPGGSTNGSKHTHPGKQPKPKPPKVKPPRSTSPKPKPAKDSPVLKIGR